jgi:hypothetical protein
VFATIFGLMSAFVVVVTVAGVRAHYRGGKVPATLAGGKLAAPSAATPRVPRTSRPGGTTGPGGRGGGLADVTWHARDNLDRQRLRNALRRIMAGHSGHIGVGVVNRTTGAAAVFAPGRPFPTTGVGKVDLLAAMLLQCQADGKVLTPGERAMAARAVELSDGVAVAALRQAAGGPDGLAIANGLLGLRRTAPASGPHQGLARTTVRDQIRLLTDLLSPASPLWPGSRSFALRLLGNVRSSRAWGITEAATPRTRSAAENGARRTGPKRLWVADSIGVIHYAGQVLEVAVLLDGQNTQLAATELAERAAVAAVKAVVAPQS